MIFRVLFTAMAAMAVASATTTCGDFTANATDHQQICVSSCGSSGGNTRMTAACKSRCDNLPVPSSSYLFGAVNYGMRKDIMKSEFQKVDGDVEICGIDALANITSILSKVAPKSSIDAITTNRRSAQARVADAGKITDAAIEAYVNSPAALDSLPEAFVAKIEEIINQNEVDISSEIAAMRAQYQTIHQNSRAIRAQVEPQTAILQQQLQDCTTTITTDVSVVCSVSAQTRQTIDASAQRIWCVCSANPIASLNSEASACTSSGTDPVVPGGGASAANHAHTRSPLALVCCLVLLVSLAAQ